ncbi:MAG TPA: C69 family dipeptidase [Egibacteraceae bacterium]|nr:C69 family dipeptidase [Egibacteraceae bacterium]
MDPHAPGAPPSPTPFSCDTFVAMPDATGGRGVLMGKNSDRPAGDTQPLRYLPRRRPSGQPLQLAYVTVADDHETFAHVGASPYWCWGHELGLNQHGVAIGNEALFTKDLRAAISHMEGGAAPDRGLLGMELVRFGLERGSSARAALDVMTALLERYGQWGSAVPGGDDRDGAYDNSYVIADSAEAWVLETSGRRWAARRVTTGYWAISNQPSIRTRWDAGSDDLVAHAVAQGWWPYGRDRPFDFALAYVDMAKPLQVSQLRVQRSRQLLRDAIEDHGRVVVDDVKRILRDHYEDTFLEGPYFNAALPDFLSICMHDSPAGFTWGNTASSAVFGLPDDGEHLPMLWWTPVTPCTGLYLPVFVHAGAVPATLARGGTAGTVVIPPAQAPEDGYDSGSYWWRFRRLLDWAKGDELGGSFAERQPRIREALDPLERAWAEEAAEVERTAVELRHEGADETAAGLLAKFTERCAGEALDRLDSLCELEA